MKTHKLLLTLLVITTSCFAAGQDLLGSIVYSILDPDDFRMVNGPGWVSCDGGKDLVFLKFGSTDDWQNQLAKAKSQTKLFKRLEGDFIIPDAQNMFIRGMNSSRIVGSVEKYTTAKPRTSTPLTPQSWDYYLMKIEKKNNKDGTVGTIKLTKDEKWSPYMRTGTNFKTPRISIRAQLTKEDRGGQEISAGWDKEETRPTNIALYMYIKVD